jgi:hypothetical protein
MALEPKSQTKMERLEEINQEIVSIETQLLKSSIKKTISETANLLANHRDKRDQEVKLERQVSTVPLSQARKEANDVTSG